MNFNSLEKFNERKKHVYFALIIIAIILALIMAGLINVGSNFFVWVLKLIIKHWGKILIGIAVLLVLKRFLFRRKQKVQEMRIVR